MPTPECYEKLNKISVSELAGALFSTVTDKANAVLIAVLASSSLWHSWAKSASESAALMAPVAALVLAALSAYSKILEIRERRRRLHVEESEE